MQDTTQTLVALDILLKQLAYKANLPSRVQISCFFILALFAPLEPNSTG